MSLIAQVDRILCYEAPHYTKKFKLFWGGIDKIRRNDWIGGRVTATPALHVRARSVRKVGGDHLYDSFATRKAHFSITALAQ